MIAGDASLKDLVFSALDYAQESGYFDHVYHEIPQAVALDMMMYDPDISQLEIETGHIVPLIQAWRKRQMN